MNKIYGAIVVSDHRRLSLPVQSPVVLHSEPIYQLLPTHVIGDDAKIEGAGAMRTILDYRMSYMIHTYSLVQSTS